MIKLGRIEYRVIEIQTLNCTKLTNKNLNNTDFLKEDNLFDADNQVKKEKKDDEEHLCKYCLMDTISENKLENCMLYPCNCENGVHFSCLKKWI